MRILIALPGAIALPVYFLPRLLDDRFLKAPGTSEWLLLAGWGSMATGLAAHIWVVAVAAATTGALVEGKADSLVQQVFLLESAEGQSSWTW